MKSVKEELFRWMCERHATNSFFDRDSLRERALDLSRSHGLNGFKCSDGWLTHFLKDHGLPGNPANYGAPAFADYTDWIDAIRATLSKYKHRDLFHADELSMYTDVPPSMIARNQLERNSDATRNRVTILMGCNSTGTTKLPLLVCGSYPSRIAVREHVYSHGDGCRIGHDLLAIWLSNLNDRLARSGRRILLFLQRDRARALKDFVASNLQLAYFPHDYPSHLRPLRRDVFHYVKMAVRRRYTEHLRQHGSDWNLRDILSSLIDAWETIPRELIVFSFQRTRFRTDDCFLKMDCDCWDKQWAGVSFRRFVTFDDALSDERQPSEADDACKLARNSEDVIEIVEDTSNTVENVDIPETGSRDSLHDGNSRTMISERRNRADRNGDRPSIRKSRGGTRGDRHRMIKQTRFKVNPIEEYGRQRKSQKRASYSGTQFSMNKRNGNRHSGSSRQKIIKYALASSDSTVGPSRSMAGKMHEDWTAGGHRSDTNGSIELVYAIVSRAIALASSTNAEYVRKLIDRFGAGKRQTAKGSAKRSNEGASDSEFCECTERESLRWKNIDKGMERRSWSNTNSPRSFSSKFNQPSTSADVSNSLPEVREIGASVIEPSVNGRHDGAAPSGAAEADQREDHSSIRTVAPDSNDRNGSTVPKEVLQVSRKKRRKSDNTSGSGDECDNGESKRKESKTDNDWSKQFETTFVFGSTPTLVQQQDKNIVDPRIFNINSSTTSRD